jgi:small subunit ribosomal protein S6
MRETGAARYYELMVITSPEGTPEELVATVEQIGGYISSAGGTILRTNYDSPWGRRRLAYPIRHESQDVRDGFYTLIHLQLDPEQVVEVERELKLNERLMRYLVLQLAAEPVFPEPEAPEGEREGEPAAPAVEGEAPSTAPAPAAEAAPEAEAPSASGEESAESRRDTPADPTEEANIAESEESAAEVTETLAATEAESDTDDADGKE